MNNLLCLPLFVLILMFDSVINSKDESVRISLTKTKHTWSQARNKCSLIGNKHTNLTFKTFDSELMWTGESARYLPWVEYLGCFVLKAEFRVDKANVEPGKQLKECLLHCKQHDFIGLQQSYCVCLHNFKLTGAYIEKGCNTKSYPAKCQRDTTAFCGSEKPSVMYAFSIYQKVNVSERLDNGNCLAVDRQNNSLSYVAHNCSTEYFQICFNGNEHHQNMKNRTWIDSFNSCPPFYMLSRYSLVYNNANFTRMGTYWLSNTRRWIQDTFTNPEFCIAARVKNDGHLQRFPIRCETKLHGLCVIRELTPTNVPSSDDKGPINKVLLISLIAATSLTILVIVIVVICVRRNYFRSNSHPTLVVQNEVVYENESNILSRNQTVNDSIDHMHYQSLNQNQNPTDSNYDILHSAEVDDSSDRQPQRVIGESAERIQMEADYQEIQDVSI